MSTQTERHFPLRDTIAVVTGASRGAGRGISIELGAAGATVYVTGRSTRDRRPDSYTQILELSGLSELPGTIEDTAEEVTRAGGNGIAVRCDHTSAEQVRALIEQIEREQGRLDVLVNNAWGGHETFSPDSLKAPFHEQSLKQWDSMFDRGVRNHILSSCAAAPLMIRQARGLIVTTTFYDRDRYLKGNLFYDLAKASMNRLAFALAQELAEHGVTSVAVSPGWMRTELVLAGHRTNEASWRDAPALARTESPRYLGRAIAALAADPHVREKTGRVLLAAELAGEYGFTDVDGRMIPAFEL